MATKCCRLVHSLSLLAQRNVFIALAMGCIYATLVLPPNVANAAEDANVLPPIGAESLTGAPVIVPRSQQYDFTSQINGLTYRLFVSTPQYGDPDAALPVIYVLDGNWYFAAVTNNISELSKGGILSPSIVVGIGYPTDNNDDVGPRRTAELTTSYDPNRKFGGGLDQFLAMIEQEVKPFIASHYKIDPAQQTLYGKSLGGLAVLRQLFRNPEAYSTYIAASPSIWWNNRDVLADEPQFSRQATAGELDIRLLITSAGNEQYRGTDPELLAQASSRMIDNASELADRLKVLNPEKLVVQYVIFPDENHGSVSLAALGRALTFALKPAAN